MQFQPRFINELGTPVAGQLAAAHDGNMYVGTETGWIPYASVISVADLSTLNVMVKYLDKIYRVGDTLYRWDGVALRVLNDVTTDSSLVGKGSDAFPLGISDTWLVTSLLKLDSE
jgi:hypothetical protein